jgi:hypothetical protein
MRSTRYEHNGLNELVPSINLNSSGRKFVNQSSFVSYQNQNNYGLANSPRNFAAGPPIETITGAKSLHLTEERGIDHAQQNRYNDIMRSINSTE